MLTKSDCLSILVELEDTGVEVNQYMKKLLVAKDVPLDVLKFISKCKGLEAANFYEMLRKKHNQKKSPLYTNILKGQTAENDVITTLTCLLTQIVLYSNKLDDKTEFLKEIRAEEVSRVLNTYFKTADYSSCVTLLSLIRADLQVFEYIDGRRELSTN